MRQAYRAQTQERPTDCVGLDERGISFMATMMLMLMIGTLGVAALTMTGLENSMAGAMRMVEEGTDAAESCVGMGVQVIKLVLDDPGYTDPNAGGLVLASAGGPVPTVNALILSQEISGMTRNNPDVAVGAGNAPNLTMTVNNYLVNGDIDFLYSKQKAGSDSADDDGSVKDFFYRVDCVAANAATGAASRVIAVFDCLLMKGAESCQRRSL